MSLIVMKFGGTSVSDLESRELVSQKIIQSIKKGNQIVVVISAMGRKGQPYATDTLLDLVDEDINYRDKDLLLSCGEVISAVVMSDILNKKGYRAHAVTGYQAGVVTDGNHGCAKCIYVDPIYTKKLLDDGIIPIVTGFQGTSEDSQITTLGRGGSDTSALIVGASVDADLVEIYTDVDGIMTADPRIAENAQFIEIINTDELFQMAAEGAKVIHPKAVEIAMEHKLNMRVRNTFSEKEGTVIVNEQLIHNPNNIHDVISSVVLLKNRTQVTITRVEEQEEHKLLKLLAEENVSLDLINIFPDSIVFTIDSDDANKCEEIIQNKTLDYLILRNLAKVTAVGSKMHGVPGVMAKIVAVLLENDCEILQSADSYTNISCLIHEADGEKAVNALHHEFIDANIEYN